MFDWILSDDLGRDWLRVLGLSKYASPMLFNPDFGLFLEELIMFSDAEFHVLPHVSSETEVREDLFLTIKCSSSVIQIGQFILLFLHLPCNKMYSFFIYHCLKKCWSYLENPLGNQYYVLKSGQEPHHFFDNQRICIVLCYYLLYWLPWTEVRLPAMLAVIPQHDRNWACISVTLQHEINLVEINLVV